MFQVSREEGRHLLEERVEAFERNITAYKSPAYNEEQARHEFINPLFEAFGWDVRNVSGFAEAYKDVIHEETLRMRVGAHAAPDYTFRIGGRRVFFVEAKKPAENIKENPRLVYQLRRYGWSAGLNLSILTDFEELAVYDCRFRPKEGDKVGIGRVDYLRYDQYLDRFEDLYCLFGKEAVMQGSLERYAESTKRQRGTAPVDKEFLKEIERWRDLLARNIALRNPNLSVRQLNFAVQRTIDRIIFLRICEDRGIEHYGRLQSLGNGTNVYERLLERFDRAEERYNSGLFHFQREKGEATEPDELSPSLAIDDKALKEIFKAIYFPASPYEFSVIGADILGQVYEQFLGKVIRLTPAHHAKVEDKPEVRKAGGVYYTPTYIVDYIVRNTVGRLCEGEPEEGETGKQVNGGRRFLLEPKQVKKLRILDPACGSGSFLIGAYQFLLDYCRDWYVANDPAKHKKAVYQGAGGQWFLTPAEKKEILLRCIHGVDIDTQAVEVTKLNLLLKALEGESRESLEQQMLFHRERALPDLGGNIKCGNSLIGSDFFDHHQGALFDDEELRRINPFDWDGPDGFPEIVKRGGFDAVIGNPPYGIVFDASIKYYIEKHLDAFRRNNDSFVAFIQKSIKIMNNEALFGFIIPNTLLSGPYYNELKTHILESCRVTEIVDFCLNMVFVKPNVFTSLIFLTKSREEAIKGVPSRFVIVSDLISFPKNSNIYEVDISCLKSLNWKPMSPIASRLLNSDLPTMSGIAWIKDVGLNYWTKGRGKRRGGSIADRVLYEGERKHPDDKPYLKGRDIDRYSISFSNHWLRHNYEKYLDASKDVFRYSPEYLERRKIVYRQTCDRLIACLDETCMLTDKTVHVIALRESYEQDVDYGYLLGVLNSKLMTYLYQAMAQEENRTFAQVKIFRVKKLPIALNESCDRNIDKMMNSIRQKAEEMIELFRAVLSVDAADVKRIMLRQIDSIDRDIDELVYQLYGLTDEEIAIVEESVKR